MTGTFDFDDVKRSSAAIRRAFVERPEEGRSPLSRLLSGINAEQGGGGRGGRTRIAVLITLLWVIASPPFDSKRVSPYWARLLGEPDPEGAGAHAVLDALHDLHERGFIQLDTTGTNRMRITLLRETGDQHSYSFPDPAEGESYFRVPRALWTSGVISEMSGRALALYLIALSHAGWGEREFWINQSLFAARYGLGETTRKKGLRELVELGVLEITSVSRSMPGELSGRTFRRNIYVIAKPFRSEGASFEANPGDEALSR